MNTLTLMSTVLLIIPVPFVCHFFSYSQKIDLPTLQDQPLCGEFPSFPYYVFLVGLQPGYTKIAYSNNLKHRAVQGSSKSFIKRSG